MLASTLSDEVLSGFLYTVLGGIGLLVFSAVVNIVRKWIKTLRSVKEAPVLQEAADLALLKADVKELKEGHRKTNEWLLGGKDLLGRDKHDGFIETFPIYQEEVRAAFTDIGKKLDQLPAKIQNGHGT